MAKMDEAFLAELRNEILFRVRVILNDRYGESVPASLWKKEAAMEHVFETIRRLETFKADADLIRLLERLRTTYTGEFGKCLSCGQSIESTRLLENPMVQFCEKCEAKLRGDSRQASTGNNAFHDHP